MREKVVLIGAGSASFMRGLVADLIRKRWDAELRLVDVNPDALDVARRLAQKMIRARRAPVRLFASTDRRDMLRGATAVICTVGVGGRRAWEKDVFIPRKYGIFQPVGDTVMPGGTSRALRMIPAMVAIAQDILDLAPHALFFNYGNPMAPVCRAIRKETGAPVVGLCHGVIGTARYLANSLGVDLAQLRYTAIGMNHLTWFVEVRVDGEDAMPRLRKMAAQRVKAASENPPRDNPFSWHLLHLFGAFPAVLDRHVVEFFPHLFAGEKAYYGKTLGVEEFPFEPVIARGDERFEEMRRDALSKRPLPADYFDRFSGEHEQVLEIIESIRKDGGTIYSANLPNRGQIPNLPEDAILESPAVAEGNGLRPITQPPLPSGIVGTLATRLAWVETTVEAALERSRAKFIQALLLDGAVRSIETATRLADDLLSAHAEHLGSWE